MEHPVEKSVKQSHELWCVHRIFHSISRTLVSPLKYVLLPYCETQFRSVSSDVDKRATLSTAEDPQQRSFCLTESHFLSNITGRVKKYSIPYILHVKFINVYYDVILRRNNHNIKISKIEMNIEN